MKRKYLGLFQVVMQILKGIMRVNGQIKSAYLASFVKLYSKWKGHVPNKQIWEHHELM